MSLPVNVVLSTRIISLPHLGHVVRDAPATGLLRYISLNQERHFIDCGKRLIGLNFARLALGDLSPNDQSSDMLRQSPHLVIP
jgi:hypothetical protein